MNPNDKPDCFMNYMGMWLMEPSMMNTAVQMAQTGAFTEMAQDHIVEGEYYTVADNVALVEIEGPMMKARSKFGGASTVEARRALREADRDNKVESVLLKISSGGGAVSGTKELADVVGAMSKPIYAYIEDMGASAAYWTASQADKVFVNEMGYTGSLGVVAVLHDYSGSFERNGIKVHVVSTGDLKGAGTPGAPISEEYLQEVQAQVDDINKVFMSSVASGRKLSLDSVKKLATGATYNAEKSLEYGLVDGIATFEAVFDQLRVQAKMAGESRHAMAKLNLSNPKR